MSRWTAAAIHLSISVAVGLLSATLLLGIWYPSPYFHAAGADELMLLLVGVDIVLGPILTLVVFKSGKKGLKIDLAFIAAIQSTALVYGLAVTLESRPVFLVAVIDRINLVSASDIDPIDLAKAKDPKFRTLSWSGPVAVAAELPTGQARTDLLFSSMAGKDVERLPEYYVDYDKAAAGLLTKAKSIDELPLRDESARLNLARALHDAGKRQDAVVWLPLVARKSSLVMLLDKSSGALLRAVAIDPWIK